MRPIDADYLKYRREEYGGYDDVPMEDRVKGILYLLKEDIDNAPTIEPKHGRWIKRKDAMGKDFYICSNCETEVLWRDVRGVLLRVDMQNANFCPNCGAKMERSEE